MLITTALSSPESALSSPESALSSPESAKAASAAASGADAPAELSKADREALARKQAKAVSDIEKHTAHAIAYEASVRGLAEAKALKPSAVAALADVARVVVHAALAEMEAADSVLSSKEAPDSLKRPSAAYSIIRTLETGITGRVLPPVLCALAMVEDDMYAYPALLSAITRCATGVARLSAEACAATEDAREAERAAEREAEAQTGSQRGLTSMARTVTEQSAAYGPALSTALATSFERQAQGDRARRKLEADMRAAAEELAAHHGAAASAAGAAAGAGFVSVVPGPASLPSAQHRPYLASGVALSASQHVSMARTIVAGACRLLAAASRGPAESEEARGHTAALLSSALFRGGLDTAAAEAALPSWSDVTEQHAAAEAAARAGLAESLRSVVEAAKRQVTGAGSSSSSSSSSAASASAAASGRSGAESGVFAALDAGVTALVRAEEAQASISSLESLARAGEEADRCAACGTIVPVPLDDASVTGAPSPDEVATSQASVSAELSATYPASVLATERSSPAADASSAERVALPGKGPADRADGNAGTEFSALMLRLWERGAAASASGASTGADGHLARLTEVGTALRKQLYDACKPSFNRREQQKLTKSFKNYAEFDVAFVCAAARHASLGNELVVFAAAAEGAATPPAPSEHMRHVFLRLKMMRELLTDAKGLFAAAATAQGTGDDSVEIAAAAVAAKLGSGRGRGGRRQRRDAPVVHPSSRKALAAAMTERMLLLACSYGCIGVPRRRETLRLSRRAQALHDLNPPAPEHAAALHGESSAWHHEDLLTSALAAKEPKATGAGASLTIDAAAARTAYVDEALRAVVQYAWEGHVVSTTALRRAMADRRLRALRRASAVRALRGILRACSGVPILAREPLLAFPTALTAKSEFASIVGADAPLALASPSPLTALRGSPWRVQEAVREACALFLRDASAALPRACAADDEAACLGIPALRALSLDWTRDPDDARMLVAGGVLEALQQATSMPRQLAVWREVSDATSAAVESSKSGDGKPWRKWSLAAVASGLRSGFLSRTEVLSHVFVGLSAHGVAESDDSGLAEALLDKNLTLTSRRITTADASGIHQRFLQSINETHTTGWAAVWPAEQLEVPHRTAALTTVATEPGLDLACLPATLGAAIAGPRAAMFFAADAKAAAVTAILAAEEASALLAPAYAAIPGADSSTHGGAFAVPDWLSDAATVACSGLRADLRAAWEAWQAAHSVAMPRPEHGWIAAHAAVTNAAALAEARDGAGAPGSASGSGAASSAAAAAGSPSLVDGVAALGAGTAIWHGMPVVADTEQAASALRRSLTIAAALVRTPGHQDAASRAATLPESWSGVAGAGGLARRLARDGAGLRAVLAPLFARPVGTASSLSRLLRAVLPHSSVSAAAEVGRLVASSIGLLAPTPDAAVSGSVAGLARHPAVFAALRGISSIIAPSMAAPASLTDADASAVVAAALSGRDGDAAVDAGYALSVSGSAGLGGGAAGLADASAMVALCRGLLQLPVGADPNGWRSEAVQALCLARVGGVPGERALQAAVAAQGSGHADSAIVRGSMGERRIIGDALAALWVLGGGSEMLRPGSGYSEAGRRRGDEGEDEDDGGGGGTAGSEQEAVRQAVLLRGLQETHRDGIVLAVSRITSRVAVCRFENAEAEEGEEPEAVEAATGAMPVPSAPGRLHDGLTLSVDDAVAFGGSRADGAVSGMAAPSLVSISSVRAVDSVPLLTATEGAIEPPLGGEALVVDLGRMLEISADGGAHSEPAALEPSFTERDGNGTRPRLAELRARAWRCALRNRAAGALFHMLRWDTFVRVAIERRVLGSLLDVCLTPIELPGFPSREDVERSGQIVAQRCLEALPWGGVEFDSVRDSTLDGYSKVADAMRVNSARSGVVLTGEEAQRWRLAEGLSISLLREARLCYQALEMAGDNVEAAGGWLAENTDDVAALHVLDTWHGSTSGGRGEVGEDTAVLEGVRFGAPLLDADAVVGHTAADSAAADDDADDGGDLALDGDDSDLLTGSVVAESVLLVPNHPTHHRASSTVLVPGTPVLVVTRRVARTIASRSLGQAVLSISSFGHTGTVIAPPLGIKETNGTVWVRLLDSSSGSAVSVCVSRGRIAIVAGMFGTDLSGGHEDGPSRSQLGKAGAPSAPLKTVPAWSVQLSNSATGLALRGMPPDESVEGGWASNLAGIPAGDSLVGPLRQLCGAMTQSERAQASHAARLSAVLLLLAWPRDVPFRLSAVNGADRLVLATKMIVAPAVSGGSSVSGDGDGGGGGAEGGGSEDGRADGGSSGPGSASVSGLSGVMIAALRSKLTTLVHQEARGDASRSDEGTAGASSTTWVCPACSLRNAASDAACEACGEACPAQHHDDELLSTRLIADCAANISDATRSMEASSRRSGWRLSTESRHPMVPGLKKSVVELEGASAMFVTFDTRCQTPRNDAQCSVCFFADEQCTRLVAKRQGPSHAFKPFLAPYDKLYILTTRTRGIEVVDAREDFGFRCTVRGLRGVLWSGEADVRREPSLEWGCWLLGFLVREALPASTLRGGALHSSDMVRAMVRFLRTPNAPFKPTIFHLLNSMLSCPQYFSVDDPPDLKPFYSVSRTAVTLLSGTHAKAERLFPPPQLQHALEMAASAHSATSFFGSPYFCPIDVTGLTGGSAMDSLWDPAAPAATWSPPLLDASKFVPVDIARVSEMEALCYAREIIKPLSTAARCVAGAARLGRVPDPWMLQAISDADGTRPTSVRPARLARVHLQMAQWTREMDEELVDWLSQLSIRTEKSVPSMDPKGLAVTPRDRTAFTRLGFTDDEELRMRFALLRILNLLLGRCLRLIDTTGALGPASVGGLLRSASYLMLADTKRQMLDAAVSMTTVSGRGGGSLELSSEDAAATVESGSLRPEDSRCLFVQVYEQLAHVKAKDLRCGIDPNVQLFRVAFKDQAGIDAGGLFRGTMTDICDDLFSQTGRRAGVDIFVRTPNSTADADLEPEFVPNPVRHSERSGALYKFVGVLMGFCVRSRFYLNFELAPLVWKLIAGDPVGITDLATVDQVAADAIRAVVAWDASSARPADPASAASAASAAGARAASSDDEAALEVAGELAASGIVDPEHPEMAACLASLSASTQEFMARFEIMTFRDTLPGGDRSPLVQDGERKLVLPSSRAVFVDLVVRRRVRRYARAVGFIRRGLTTMVPARALSMLGGQDLRTSVCGADVVDLGILKAHTTYSGSFKAEDPVVVRFWEAMEDLTHRERQRVIRFAWGRSKLPNGESEWSGAGGSRVSFTLVPFGSRGDESLVVAQTCYFLLQMPAYSTTAIMKERLMYSVMSGLASGYQIA